jgi:hypothetical protein
MKARGGRPHGKIRSVACLINWKLRTVPPTRLCRQEGNQIKRRARDDAVASLQGFLAVLTPLSGGERMQKFATLASAESDCGSAQEGGDLDWFESGQMMVRS